MKKRSGANSKSRPPEALTLFIDRSLGNTVVASALRQQGVATEIHSDHFPPDAEDSTWLEEVGRYGWIVLTKDRRIRYRKLELAAITRAKVRAFILTGGEMTGEEMARAFVRALPRIRKAVMTSGPPFIAKVSPGGLTEMIWPARPGKSKTAR